MEVTLESRFVELFGIRPHDITPEQRKLNWERWKELAKEAGKKDSLDFWTKENLDVCNGCIHKEGDWCKWSYLPCNYNPVLQMIGMACMGIGREESTQLEMDL